MAERLSVSVSEDYLFEALSRDPSLEVLRWDLSGPAPREVIDLVIPDYLAAKSRLARLSGVRSRLVQSQSIGYDGVEEFLPPGVVYANAASVHETSTAELTLGLIIAAQRGLADFVRAAGRGHWAFDYYPSLADRRVLLLGYGGVGQAIEARLVPFEVDVVRVARRARVAPAGPVHGVEELRELLPEVDVVVVSLPLSDETHHLVDADFFAAMKDGALFVNVGRGPLVDTEAMLASARSGRLRFALDVVEGEPLPDGHPLFALANVLISPHVGGATSAMHPRVLRLVARQIERLRRGEEALNVVLRS